VVDATNLRKKDRMSLVSLVPKEAKIRYIVVDRPLEEKLRDGGWRLDVKFPQKDGTVLTLIEKHHQTFKSQERDIMKGDGLPNVEVVDMRKSA
jgi:predicted kinase